MAIQTIKVNTQNAYEVLVGDNLIGKVGEYVLKIASPSKALIVTDDVVSKLYLQTVKNSLAKSGFTVEEFVFPAGESSKTVDTYLQIISRLAELTFTRTDIVVALGGGVVGDVAGFSASTYLRGIKCVQIPTTLLAQIDSSVGGKTAVNLPQGKNLLGAFYQPALVICDVDVLTDLPKSVLLAGYGEMLKYALLDKKVFDELAGHGSLVSLVKLCIEYKRDIVERDEKESGERRLLNLGHTPGHGIEKASNYTIQHGIGVSYGLKIMAGYSLKKGYIDKALYDSIVALIDDTVTLQKLPYSAKTIAENAKSDKKRAGDTVTIVTIHGIGDCQMEKVKVEDLEEVFSAPVYED